MSGFSIDWLNLRESADHRARALPLLVRARHWLEDAGPGAVIIDLGAGTGSTLRAVNVSQAYWHLVDHDAALLAEARRRHGAEFALATHAVDLCEFDALPLQGARMISASALFDLVSKAFCDALVARLTHHRAALYAALSYDGLMRWTPTHRLDAAVLEAFNADQRRDKGLGPALGPQATSYLEQALSQRNYQVVVARSPWRLGPEDAALVCELCRGCAAAVRTVFDTEVLAQWLRYRLENARSGTCVVGHSDLWAQPLECG
jgi:hypothetical protein